LAEKQSSIVLNFETKGQIQYAKTIKDINAILNAAAKEYRSQIKAMGDDATATDKLRAEKKKLETQLEAGQERTKKLREEFLKMQDNSKTTTAQLSNMYGKLKDSEAAEAALESRLKEVNQGLSQQAEESRKSQSELSNLQNESAQLESQVSKLNSEFKLQESALGDNATEMEKAGLANEKFAKQSELAEKQISNLEKQLEIIKREYGENSIEANKMETELNEAKTAFNNLNNEMHGTKGAADSAQDGMGRVTELLQSQVYMEASQQLAQISDKLIEIGKASVETAAKFQAGDAQFEQVFGNMEKKARETVAALGEQMGILPRRLEPGYAAISSQLMSLGVESEQALKLAEQALISSADAAAFYDTSLESAQERVQSFIKGNLNAAESIGIFATVNSLSAWAMENDMIPAVEGATQATEAQMIAVEKAQKSYNTAAEKYGADSVEAREKALKLKEANDKVTAATSEQAGKWEELSEAQKQAIRVEYIKDMQKMGEVTGQASREMDGYENVMGNLGSSMDEVKASLGEVILPMVLEFAQIIIPALASVAEWFRNLNPAIKSFVVVFGAVLVVAGQLLPMFAALSLMATAAGVTIGTFIVGTLLPAIGIIAGVAAAIAAIVVVIKNWGSISEWLSKKWKESVEVIKKTINILGESFQKNFDEIKKYLSDMLKSWQESWNKMIENIVKFKEDIVEKFTELKDSVVSKFVEIKDGVINTWNQVLEFLQPFLDKIIDIIMVPVSLIQTILEALWLTVKAGFDIASAYIMQIFDMLSVWFTQKGEEFKAIAIQVFEAFKENIINPVAEAKDKVIEKVVELWNTLIEKFEGIKTAVSSKWNEIKDTIVAVFTNAKNKTVEVADNLWTSVIDKFQSIYNSTKEKFNNIKDAMIEPFVKAKDKIKEVIEAIKDLFFNIKLPKFGLKTSTKIIAGKEISYPSGIDVKWNAKGGIFTQPTIFGASGGRLQGAGEAGPEAVLPLTEENLAAIGRGIPGNGASIENHFHIGKLDANNPSELDRLNRTVEQANKQMIYELGGDPA
jgi:phage-related minor tail protein